jgi:hypothetical protein
LTPEHANGFDALSDALPALHEQLAGGGVEVNVTLGQPGDPEGRESRHRSTSGGAGRIPTEEGATQVAVTSADPMTTAEPGRIHLVL